MAQEGSKHRSTRRVVTVFFFSLKSDQVSETVPDPEYYTKTFISNDRQQVQRNFNEIFGSLRIQISTLFLRIHFF